MRQDDLFHLLINILPTVPEVPGACFSKLPIQYNTIQYNTIQYNTIQYNTIQYNTIQYNTIQYNTYSLRHRKCGVRGFIHELFVSKTRTSEVRASEGF